MKKGSNPRYLGVAELSAQLGRAHHTHRLLEVPDLAGMEIGGGQFDVAQGRHLEDVLVARRFRNRESTLVVGRQNVGAWPLDDPERSIHAAADVDAVVATGAALIDK